MNEKLRLAFAGTPAIAADVLASMLANGYFPQFVLTQPDRPSGRGLKLVSSPVKILAEQHSIPVLQPLSFKREPQVLAQIREYQLDLLIVFAYGLILPQELLGIPRLGCINIHVSLLPQWRGAAPIARAILAGDTQTGVCIMQMDAGLDTGDIRFKQQLPIEEDDTTGTLQDKLANLGSQMLIQFLANPLQYPPVKQNSLGISYAAKLEKAEARINWQDNATVIERKIRGYNPVPGAFSQLQGVLHKIWAAKVVPGTTTAKAGTIITASIDKLHVACGDGTILALYEIQEAGAKKNSVRQYLQAHYDLPGKQFRVDEK